MVMNALVDEVRNAVNIDFKRKDEAISDNGYVELDHTAEYNDVITALYTLNNDYRFNFTLGYDPRLNLVTWLRSDNKAEYRVSSQDVIAELQVIIDAIKAAEDDKLISYIIKDETGYYIETIDGSTDIECNINLTLQ